MRYVCLFLYLLVCGSPAFAGQVVVTIKPLHSLVASVMEGDESPPLLLVDGKSSLHTFSLKPSQVQALNHADIIFYMGDDFELFMATMLDSLPTSLKRVSMEKVKGLVFYPVRSGSDFKAHAHADHEEHHDEANDLHLWMSPTNAQIMVSAIAKALSEQYPEKRTLYMSNARKISAQLSALDEKMRERMLKLSGKSFVVFHDAYQYFEKDYMLTNVGSITVHPEQGISAKRLSDIRAKIKTNHAKCVFREPQFDGKVVDNLIEGTGARAGLLDPEGALLNAGPDLYLQLIEALATGLESCLAQPS